jgi:hypothetical protein
MTRALLSAVVLGTLLATPSSSAVDCGSPYVAFLERVSVRAQAMQGETLVSVHRRALRIFDACDCGHMTDVERRLADLEKQAHSDT